MKNAFLIMLLLAPAYSHAQNLTGTWVGYGGGTDFIQMVITHKGDSLFGYTYDEGGGFCKATFKGRYDKVRKRLVGRGIEMIENTPNHVLVSYDLYYDSFKDAEYLRERSGGETYFDRIFNESRPLVLKRISKRIKKQTVPPAKSLPPSRPVPPVAKVPGKPASPKPLAKPPVKTPSRPQPSLTPATTTVQPRQQQGNPSSVTRPSIPKQNRDSKLAGAISTAADSLMLTLYDNGEVDGDTVSVYFNNTMVLDKFRISEKGKSIVLPLKPGLNTIEMFAHNLGAIPPNTALLIISSGTERHELRTSADLKTNARIDIRKTE